MPSVIRQPGVLPTLFLKMEGSGQAWSWRLYTRAMVLLQAGERSQALQAGWNQGQLDLSEGLSPGVYFVELKAKRAGIESQARILKFFVLR